MPDEYLNSVNLNIKKGFPYLCMDIENGKSVPECPGFHVMHWHEDVQFICVFTGKVYLHTLDRTMIVPAGEGIFINKGVVHLVVADPTCHYRSFLFPEQLVSFYPGSPAAKYVKRITDCEQIQCLPLSPGIEWQHSILERLRGLSRLEAEPSECYEYEVLAGLAALWLDLTKHAGAPDRPAESETLKRTRIFLEYIERHYAEDVTLEALAQSASVSKSECLRCFRTTMQDTPYRYLIEYRLQKAAGLLRDTECPIGQVALAVGFRSQSHFGKLFKERTGYTPKKYREFGDAFHPAASWR